MFLSWQGYWCRECLEQTWFWKEESLKSNNSNEMIKHDNWRRWVLKRRENCRGRMFFARISVENLHRNINWHRNISCQIRKHLDRENWRLTVQPGSSNQFSGNFHQKIKRTIENLTAGIEIRKIVLISHNWPISPQSTIMRISARLSQAHKRLPLWFHYGPVGRMVANVGQDHQLASISSRK